MTNGRLLTGCLLTRGSLHGVFRQNEGNRGVAKDWHAGDFLDLWTLTGGVARYVALFMDCGALTRRQMLKTVFGLSTPFVDEGKTVLVEEFGRDYGTYFAILAGIASGRTTFAELKNLLDMDVGGYLTKLERDYSIISQKQPIFETARNKNCHYRIDDCFFRFWFRFIYRNQDMVELGRFRELRALADRDLAVFQIHIDIIVFFDICLNFFAFGIRSVFALDQGNDLGILVAHDIDAFSGYALERYFRWKFTECTTYTRMGGWWDRKGENEIDLVCEDELARRLDFYEVKRDPARLDLRALQAKTEAFFAKNPERRALEGECRGLSLADM